MNGRGRDMATADWFFDFVSPFAYLQHKLLDRLPGELAITRKPVLFAGLLRHWGQKGPAEIPGKRLHTYRFCRWFAERHDIPFVMLPAHPFNSLKALRLAVARDGEAALVAAIFHAIWHDGQDIGAPARWAEITAALGIAEADSLVADPVVKDRLRANTDDAIARGVFGVPSFLVTAGKAREELFWGVDSTEMVADYIADPGLFARVGMADLEALPMASRRRM